MTKQHLIWERTRIEIEYTAKLNLFDMLVDHWTQEEAVAVSPTPTEIVLPQGATKASVEPENPKRGRPAKQVNSANETAAREDAAPRDIAGKLRLWIDNQPAEFQVSDARSAVSGTQSAVSCAMAKLIKVGQVERVRYGWYRRTAKWVAPKETVSDRYAKAREALHTKVANGTGQGAGPDDDE
jgi:hypothetical protein